MYSPDLHFKQCARCLTNSEPSTPPQSSLSKNPSPPPHSLWPLGDGGQSGQQPEEPAVLHLPAEFVLQPLRQPVGRVQLLVEPGPDHRHHVIDAALPARRGDKQADRGGGR